MDQDSKSTWKCPECCCKQLKTDNTDTPVRPAKNTVNISRSPNRNPTSSHKTIPKIRDTSNTPPDAMNVTLRKKSSQPMSTPSNQETFLNENMLRDIIKEELAAALKSSFKELLTEQLRNIKGELSEFKNSFGFFNEQFEEFKKRFDEKDAIINQLRNDNANLQQSVNYLTTRLCNVEQYTRESNVEISGLPEDKSEDLVKTIQTIAKNEKLGKADYEQIKTHLKNINWYDTFHECVNANERLNAFYVVLQSVIDNFVPKYTKKRSKYPAWYSDSLIRALSEKEKFRQRYRKYKNPRDKLTFELLRSRCHTLINNCYNAYKCKIENDIPKNPKAFWRYIKDKRRGESCIPADMYMNDKNEKNNN
ncbi:hypothetical protein SFRURICE_020337 [Spodoptera frugiperda]|nr:hypothetical protein SFRURICE_020337 [Spodoptera frugiperda]